MIKGSTEQPVSWWEILWLDSESQNYKNMLPGKKIS